MADTRQRRTREASNLRLGPKQNRSREPMSRDSIPATDTRAHNLRAACVRIALYCRVESEIDGGERVLRFFFFFLRTIVVFNQSTILIISIIPPRIKIRGRIVKKKKFPEIDNYHHRCRMNSSVEESRAKKKKNRRSMTASTLKSLRRIVSFFY